MRTTTVIKDAEDNTEGAQELEEDEDRHAVINIVTRTEPVLITATSVVQKLLVIRSLQLLTTSKADLPKTTPLETLGKN